MPRRRRVSVPITQVRRRLGFYLQLARRADIVILRYGKPVAVLISIARYRKLAAGLSRTTPSRSGPTRPRSRPGKSQKRLARSS